MQREVSVLERQALVGMHREISGGVRSAQQLRQRKDYVELDYKSGSVNDLSCWQGALYQPPRFVALGGGDSCAFGGRRTVASQPRSQG